MPHKPDEPSSNHRSDSCKSGRREQKLFSDLHMCTPPYTSNTHTEEERDKERISNFSGLIPPTQSLSFVSKEPNSLIQIILVYFTLEVKIGISRAEITKTPRVPVARKQIRSTTCCSKLCVNKARQQQGRRQLHNLTNPKLKTQNPTCSKPQDS